MRVKWIGAALALLLCTAPVARAQQCMSVSPQTYYAQEDGQYTVQYYITITASTGKTTLSADLSSLPSAAIYDGYSFVTNPVNGSGSSGLDFLFDDSQFEVPIGSYPITITASGACQAQVTVYLDVTP